RDVLCSRVHTPQDDAIAVAAGRAALEAANRSETKRAPAGETETSGAPVNETERGRGDA
ncbi:acyl-CoA dehydrogenase, partial [Burkholderia contaminans]